MKVDLSEVRKKTVLVDQYIDCIKQPFSERFLTRKQTYQLKLETVNQLKEFTNKYLIVAFSAEWCKDCAANIPVLALISEATGLEIRVFGGLKRDPLNPKRKWRIPPSPPEVETFNVDKTPTIILIDRDGKEVERIIENPKYTPTLEQELYEIIKKKQ